MSKTEEQEELEWRQEHSQRYYGWGERDSDIETNAMRIERQVDFFGPPQDASDIADNSFFDNLTDHPLFDVEGNEIGFISVIKNKKL